MGTKKQPGTFDCYDKAEDDEPLFTLLARDVQAPTLVRTWATKRARRAKTKEDMLQCIEAFECADAMEAWRKAHR